MEETDLYPDMYPESSMETGMRIFEDRALMELNELDFEEMDDAVDI